MKRRFVTEELKQQMAELEASGKSRKEIAEILDLDPATVTRHLGAVKPHRWLRTEAA